MRASSRRTRQAAKAAGTDWAFDAREASKAWPVALSASFMGSTPPPFSSSPRVWIGLSTAGDRRRKAAAKCRLRWDLQTLLPRFAIVDTARDNDAPRAREGCAGIRAG